MGEWEPPCGELFTLGHLVSGPLGLFSRGLVSFGGRPHLVFSSVYSLTCFFSGAVSSFPGALFLAEMKSSTLVFGAAFSSGDLSTMGAVCVFGAASTTGPSPYQEPTAQAQGVRPLSARPFSLGEPHRAFRPPGRCSFYRLPSLTSFVMA